MHHCLAGFDSVNSHRTTENEVMLVTVERLQCASLMGMRQLFLTLPPDQIDDSMKSCLRRLLGDSKFYGLAKPPMNAVRGQIATPLSSSSLLS